MISSIKAADSLSATMSLAAAEASRYQRIIVRCHLPLADGPHAASAAIM
ncbi:hypothetical protein HMPREF9622_01436 [Cutibacterium modestum HL037PA3]|nr:hypothetical protein HMPREF9622_01436 [Cutibacterium modestum HL037PA3]